MVCLLTELCSGCRWHYVHKWTHYFRTVGLIPRDT